MAAVDYTRRQVSLMAGLLAAGAAEAQEHKLPSRIYEFSALPVRQNGPNRSRAILRGETYNGCPLEMHMTELAAGQAPHPPHHHVHEEMVILREGTLEVTVAGKTSSVEPGSVIYFASGEPHGMRNPGPGRAQYYVIALGQD